MRLLTRCLRCRGDAKDGPGRDRQILHNGEPSLIAISLAVGVSRVRWMLFADGNMLQLNLSAVSKQVYTNNDRVYTINRIDRSRVVRPDLTDNRIPAITPPGLHHCVCSGYVYYIHAYRFSAGRDSHLGLKSVVS
jgi:hypothetical protein